MSQSEIVKNPEILGGKPIIAGTRISVDLIVKFITNGDTVAGIIRAYPHLTQDQVKAAIEYADKELQRERVKLEPAAS